MKASSDTAGCYVDFVVGVGLASSAVDYTWTVFELGDVFKAVCVQGEVVGYGDIREL